MRSGPVSFCSSSWLSHFSLFLNLVDPPSFLFDAIPEGSWRRFAGFLLWAHVAVSYAINSQALCSSLDRLWLQPTHKNTSDNSTTSSRYRWLCLTSTVAISSFLVANAIPFFKDLVALIGALTSVPLTLTIPAVLHAVAYRLRLWCPSRQTLTLWGLFVFSLGFLAIGLTGAISSIDEDWLNQGGKPFSCS